MCRVLNARFVGKAPVPCRVYIGRPSKWGNPFDIGRDGSREDVIAWLAFRPELFNALGELRGRDLVCAAGVPWRRADRTRELALTLSARQEGRAVSAC